MLITTASLKHLIKNFGNPFLIHFQGEKTPTKTLIFYAFIIVFILVETRIYTVTTPDAIWYSQFTAHAEGLLKFSHLGLKGSATAAYHASFKEQEPQISLQLVHETKSVHI